jgi:uncharacterized BrkB/YihY/UPF0761 family membrane protein
MATPPSASRRERLTSEITRRREELEKHSFVGFPLESYRRFKAMDGKNYALVIGTNLFISIIPLFIIFYSLLEAFNPHRSFGVILVQRFHLSGETADIVRSAFTNAKSGENVALSISFISLFVTGFSIAAAIQTVYARAFRMEPLRGFAKYVRGGAWLLALLVLQGLGLTLRYWAASRPIWFFLLIAPVLIAGTFAFYLVTPRLVVDMPFSWRDLVPGALACTGVAIVINVAMTFLLRNWFSAYGHAYGGFGVGLALISAVGVLATFWVWIAAVSGVYWEWKAGSAKVAAMEELSEQDAGVA